MNDTVAVLFCLALSFGGIYCHTAEEVKSYFEMSTFDRNSDGELSGMEVYYLLLDLARTQGYTHKEARTILALVDANGDGKLQESDFQDLRNLLQTDTSLKTISTW